MQRIQIFKFLILLASSTAWCAPSFGATAPCQKKAQVKQCVVPLQKTLELTYMKNAELDAARAGLRAKVEDLSEANADWRPSLSVTGNQDLNATYPNGTALGPNTERHTTGYIAEIRQNVYRGGRTVADIGKTESDVFAGNAGLFSTEQKVLFGAVQAHTDIVRNEAVLRYRQEALTFAQTRVEDAQARYEVGAGGRADVAVAEGELENATANVAQALGDLEISKAVYTHQVGCCPGNLAQGNIIVSAPKCCEKALCVAKAHNPTITEAQYTLEAAEYVVDHYIGELLPEVDVRSTAGHNRNAGTAFPVPRRQADVFFGATVTVPIYLQGKPSARIRRSYQLVAQQKVLLVNVQRQVVEDTRTAWAALIAARSKLKSYMAEVKAQELAVEGIVAEYDAGIKSIVDVFVERNKLTDAQIQLVSAEKTLIDANYGVLQAMGRLTACDLKLKVQYYNPNAYYDEYKDAWIQFWQGDDLRYVKDGAY